MSHSPKQRANGHAVWGSIIRRGMAATAAILALTSTAGCMVEAMYAVPVALDTAGSAIARVLPVNEKKYIVHSNRLPPGEPALAAAQEPSSALADAARPAREKVPPPTPTPAATTPATAVASPVPMPVLGEGALARRTRT